ncbi:dephospho-CoA kinase [Mycoplasma sp. Ms02]|uniref:dephospho-CoA kinase n=1 Tax=Mycoplasma sp. Ms02 TaxID=353851 RepID=UPI001C890E8F|nr:dephospho-CoA kinase [Mycoplasma sp. Ms02]QZE12339.1 dephospho-CoA kinase [Mycoplasma sp. Ms02]
MIAITGLLKVGKTTFLKRLEQEGFKVLYLDDYVNLLYATNQFVIDTFQKQFGSQVIEQNQVSKSALKKILEDDFSKIYEIEKIVFPLIYKHLEENQYDLVEIPILKNDFVNFEKFFNLIINVKKSKKKTEKIWKSMSVNNSLILKLVDKNGDFFGKNRTFANIPIVNISSGNLRWKWYFRKIKTKYICPNLK